MRVGIVGALVWVVLATAPGAAEWAVRPGTGAECALEGSPASLSDGYQTTTARIRVDRKTVSVSSPSVLDPSFKDIGIAVDDGAPVSMDRLADPRTAVFESQYATLVEQFKRAALEHTPAADRLVVDTGDGAALCFLGDPEDALFAANSLRSGVRDMETAHRLHLRLGINLGPVRVVKDINGHGNVIGDGINVAQRVMSFAVPDQILVSRSYFEVVSRLSPEYGQLFQYVGLHRDKHVREHEVYEVQLAAPARRDGSPEGAGGAPVVGPADAAAERPARFEPALLARLTSVLAREIGPVARLVVGRAADRATDRRGLCALLADNVPEPSRAALLAELTSMAGAAAPGAPPAGVEAFEVTPAPGRGEVGPAVLARAEQLLTRQIGPVARVLVRQAALHAKDPRDLFERLAVHIDEEGARRAFIAAAGE